MNDYQTYTVRDSQDLTGMYVVADKPITVISALSYTSGIPAGDKDPAATCLPPVSDLGLVYILPPIAGRDEPIGHYAQVVAAYDNTQVITAPGVSTTEVLLRGEHKMVYMNSPYPTTVSCSQRCLVVMYNKARNGDYTTGIFMMLVPSVTQSMVSAAFNTFVLDAEEDKYVSIDK